VKKLIVLGLGTSAAALATLITAGTASSDPAAQQSPYNVVGEPYGKAVQILKSAGIKATFGGAVGSDMQQNLCVVSKQKFAGGKMLLNLNCTQEAFDEAGLSNSTGSGPGGSTIGANGVTTVTPTPMPPPGAGVPTPVAPVPPPA
jgi:hypothetical protein